MNVRRLEDDGFWDDYVQQHRHPVNRALHATGTGLAVLAAGLGVVRRRPALLLAAPVIAYAFSLCGHLVFERNRPASVEDPLRSLLANFVMIDKMVRGEMEAEVARVDRERASAGRQPNASYSHLN